MVAKMKIPDGRRSGNGGKSKPLARGILLIDRKEREQLAGAVLGGAEPTYGKTEERQARVIVWNRSPEPLA